MATLFVILSLIQANLGTIIFIQQSLFSALSAFFQMIKMPKTSKFFGTFSAFDAGRAVRWLGPILQRIIDMRKVANVGIVALVMLSVSGCAWFKGAVTAGQAACQTELANVPEVIAEAKVRGISVDQLVDAFCGMVDVASIFTSEAKPGTARKAALPRNQAVTLLRAKGELE